MTAEFIATLPDWIWEVNAAGRYTYSSPHVFYLLGYTPEEILGLHLSDLLHPEDAAELASLLDELFLARKPISQITKCARGKDGREVWLESSAVPVLGAQGALIGYRGIDRDVTTRRVLDDQHRRIDRFVTTRRVVACISHDFNNLLAPTLGYAELLRSQLAPDHPTAHLCDLLMEATLKLAEINETLLAFGYPDRRADEPVGLNQVVANLIEQGDTLPETLTLNIELAAGLFPVYGSTGQLTQALAHLIRNTREAMGGVGTLTIRTENVYVDEPTGAYNRVDIGEYVRLTVQDTGPGIASEILERIFDPFFTTKEANRHPAGGPSSLRGLGLSLVQAIVDGHHGFVDVVTQVGQGTSFQIYLPAQRELLRERAAEGLTGGDETLLLVDDDAEQLRVTRELLTTLGYQVDVVRSGAEAVAYCRTRQVDLLVLDMVMPPGIDGVETFRQIRKVRPRQRALLLSGYATSDQVATAYALGVGTFLPKPVTLGQLSRAIRRELERTEPATIECPA